MKKKLVVLVLSIAIAAFFFACISTTVKQDSNSEEKNPSNFINMILDSYSERAFKEGAVPDDMIETILKCAQKAPSAGNGQPWHFTVITNNEVVRQTAPRHYVEGAAVIVISGKPNERTGVNIAFDTALASQNIYLAAQALGLGVRPYYSGVQNINDNQKRVLGIPDDYIAQIIMLIGFKADDVDVVTSASVRNSFENNVNFVK